MSRHFVKLENVLSQQHLNKYLGDSEKLGKYDDQWIGLPLLLKYTLLLMLLEN